ncbi:hypothetical protein MRB53_020680 [Persea americana]|uniref:Uncharacterized protein n=1 Tax=Persea americana TaxID=3435 RepID=A0ACC2L2Y6_PERAE|nr:hypothetical protein MRB53_020680 [Persea americana]
MPTWNLGKAVIFEVIGLALIAALVAIAIFLPSKENGVKWDALYSVPVAAGGMAQSDMITDDPSGANLSMVFQVQEANCRRPRTDNRNCNFPHKLKLDLYEEMILPSMLRQSLNSEEMILRSMISTTHMRSVKEENEE